MFMPMFTRRFHRNFKTIERLFRGLPVRYLEIGVFLGSTSEWMLDNILTHPDARLVGIDPWIWFKTMRKRFPTEEIWEKEMLDRIESLRIKYKGRADFIQGYSQDILRRESYKDNSFDLIYIDGQHTILSVLRDFSLSWPLLKVGGVMIFDDYLNPRNNEVKESVDLILRGIGKDGKQYELLFKNYQVGIRKLK